MTDTTNKTTIEIVGDLIERELGERWGDGYVVTDVIVGYAEPGYGDDDTVVVLGDWNNYETTSLGRYPGKRVPLFKWTERTPERLADALSEIDGVEIEWLDEWYSCSECYRAVRSQPNSYSWKPYYAFLNECEPICADCLMQDVDGSISAGDWINNSSNAITWISGSPENTLNPIGFFKWEPGNEQDYANGWYPGQNDDPRKILESILDRHPEAEVVFLIDANGQFSAWVRGIDDETDNDNEED